MFIIYAHRGASSYCAENTMPSFEMGAKMANGIETDVHITKDGVLVLFHDDILDNVTEKTGRIGDYTWEELKTIPVIGRKDARMTPAPIPTLEEFLIRFGKSGINLALELKDDGIEEAVIDMVEKYCDIENVTITAFERNRIENVLKLRPRFKTGWLIKEYNMEGADKICVEKGISEICPKTVTLTNELVDCWHKMGLNVRAWGVFTEDDMKKVVICGADGTTVNFPDKLAAFLKEYNALPFVE